MKYFVIILVLIGFSGSILFGNHVYGLWIPQSPEELLEQSQIIFVGNITTVTPVDVEYQSQVARNGTVKDTVGPEVMTLEEYTVDVEEFLKNPQDSDTMTVLRATVGGVPSGPSKIRGFEIGDRVLFYLPKDEKQTHFPMQYMPESFKIPKQCDAKSALEEPRIIGANDFRIMQDGIAMKTNFTANKSIQFIFNKDMRTLDGASFNVTVTIAKINEDKTRDIVLSKTIHAESKPCEWIASTELEFVPTAGEYYKMVQITHGTIEESYSGPFLVVEGLPEIAKDSPCFDIEENRHAPCNPDKSLKFYDYMGKQWMGAKKQEMLDAFQADRFHEWIDKAENYFHWNVYQYYSYTEDLTKFLVYPSPFKQLSLGILPQDINCKTGLFLIQKHDSSPACVKPETKQKLIERGWAKNKTTKTEFHDTEYSIDEQGKVDLSKIDLPKTDKGRIDYTRLGYLVSETQFKKMLAESEIEYEPDNFTLITGMQLDSEPPYTDYCGYIEANDMKDYWFSSAYHNDTLTGYGLHSDNPNPCKPNTGSCLCSLQTQLAESTITEFSYFDKEQQSYIAEILTEYVSENRNLTPKFLIGQYNMDYEEDVMAFCGEFWGYNTFDYFMGWIQNGSVVGFGIEKELPKLCAISDDAQYFGKVLGEE